MLGKAVLETLLALHGRFERLVVVGLHTPIASVDSVDKSPVRVGPVLVAVQEVLGAPVTRAAARHDHEQDKGIDTPKDRAVKVAVVFASVVVTVIVMAVIDFPNDRGIVEINLIREGSVRTAIRVKHARGNGRSRFDQATKVVVGSRHYR